MMMIAVPRSISESKPRKMRKNSTIEFAAIKLIVVVVVTVVAASCCSIPATFPAASGFLFTDRSGITHHNHQKTAISRTNDGSMKQRKSIIPRIQTTTATISTFQRQQTTYCASTIPQYVASTRTSDQALIENNDDEMEQQFSKLMSYVNNLQIARKQGDIKPSRSLAYYLSQNPIQQQHGDDLEKDHNNMMSLIENACERALTQALRTAGDNGDYRLIMQLIDSVIVWANDRPVLSPRIFGEAISAMAATKANISKIKQIWNLVSTNPNPKLLSKPLSAFELTTMINALASRGKVGACIDMYEQYTTTSLQEETQSDSVLIRPDVYTASSLFTILAESIHINQKEEFTKPFDNRSSSSPSSSLGKSLNRLTYSSCWQWNTAVKLLATMDDETFQWNNHGYAAFLKLHDVAQETFPQMHKNGPRIAIAVIDSMINKGIHPDVVTCTLAIKAMGSPNTDPMSWKLAVAFFEKMKSDPTLPNPNHYTYSAVIVACARCKEYEMALRLIEEMRSSSSSSPPPPPLSSVGAEEPIDEFSTSDNFVPPKPNTWVYNAAFLAIGNVKQVQKKKRKQSKTTPAESSNITPKRSQLALELLEQMKEDYSIRMFDTKPDTVTYNTILTILGNVRDEEIQSGYDNTQYDGQIVSLIQQMHDDGIARDTTTYKNAILSVSSSSTVLKILSLCLLESAAPATEDAVGKKKQRQRQRINGAVRLSGVFNSALASFASRAEGNKMVNFQQVCSLMDDKNIRFNSETTSIIIDFLGNFGRSSSMLDLFTVLGCNIDSSKLGEDNILVSSQRLEDATGLSFTRTSSLPPLEAEHFSRAITVCLLSNDLERAHTIYSYMRKNEIKPTLSCLENFSIAYANAAIATITDKKHKNRSVSLSRAQSAYKIAMALNEPTLRALSIVAKACAMTGQWKEAQAILRAAHATCLKQHDRSDVVIPAAYEAETLRSLHTGILRQCAKQGNVTVALWYADDIQRFARRYRSQLERHTNITSDESSLVHSTRDMREVWYAFKNSVGNDAEDDDISSNVGMRAQDWVSLVKAASESGHWRVCVNSLQFLRPYLEKTSIASSTSVGKSKQQLFDSHYEQLTPALTAAAYCLEKRSQYAWGIKMIEDWMDWSGRKPRPEAVLAVIRILSTRGRGEEVKILLTRCIEEGTPAHYSKKGVSYEEMLYIGTITALHNNGLYDDADEVMISGISQGSLPFDLEHRDGRVELDLHGLNLALAHSTVRIAMRQQATNSTSESQEDMVLITGRGRNSALRLRPVLRPEVQRMLLEEFYPPLNTISEPGNLGALLVFADDISAWQSHQEQQRGVRMMALASVLKNFSTERLTKVIALTSEGRTKNDDEVEDSDLGSQ